MNARLEVNLLRLSLQNVTGRRQPSVPDNAARYRAFRQFLPAPSHNAHDWPHCQRERLSPAHCLPALPSRLVAGSSPEVMP